MTTTAHVLSYDAGAILGFSKKLLPAPKPGEIVIRYGGWSLQELRDSPVGQRLMHRQDWYDSYPWSAEVLPPGIYRLRLPVSDSNHRTFAEQEAMLPVGEAPAPAVLVATALLVHKLHTGEDLLQNGWMRCKERTTADSDRVVLHWYDGRLDVGHGWDADPNDYVWLAAVRTS